MYKIYGIVYVPENRIIYVGQTNSDIEFRFATHIYHSYMKGRGYNRKLPMFIREHQIHDFNIIIIENNIETLDEAYKKEQYWIAKYDTYYNGCNGSLGGGGAPTIPFSEREQICRDYSNGTSLRDLTYKYDRNRCTIRRIIMTDMKVSTVHDQGLQPPPFYIGIPCPWSINIPNEDLVIF